MKNKTKILALSICLILFGTMAMGSGESSGEKKDIVPVDGSVSTEGGITNEESASDEVTPEDSAPNVEVSIEEQVIVDQDDIKITATEYAADSIFGDGIKLLVENNSGNDYTIGCDALIVNDYMITDLFACEIAAGKKANETMYLSSAELKAAGIENVGKVEMYFHAFDSNYDSLFSGVYSEVKTSAYDSMDTVPNDAGTELYNKDGIKIVGKTVDENSFWGTAILLYCENTSGKNVGISVDDMSINGFMMNPLFSTTVYADKKAFDEITIFSSDLEDNGIETIEEVELKFRIYNSESYETIDESEPITFSAQ